MAIGEKSRYGDLIVLSVQLEKARERLAADKRVLDEAQMFYNKSYGLVKTLENVISCRRREYEEAHE